MRVMLFLRIINTGFWTIVNVPPVAHGAVEGLNVPPMAHGAVEGLNVPPVAHGAVEGLNVPPMAHGAVEGLNVLRYSLQPIYNSDAK